jgi:hypothetical protein
MPARRRTLSTTERKAGRGAKGDRRDLSKRPAEHRDNRDRGKSHSGPYTIGGKRFGHTPESLSNDSDSNEL